MRRTTSASTGALQTQITSLTTRDGELQQKVDDINSAASTLQSQLETQYAKYQAAIESANSTLDLSQGPAEQFIERLMWEVE